MIPTRPPISDRTSSVEEEAPPLPQLVPSGFYGYLKPSTCGLRVWLREQGDVEEDPPSAFGEMLMRLGIEHERRHLERFPNHIDIGELPWDEQPEATIEEVGRRERVIYQGHLRAETTLAGRRVEIIGLPDFMLPARSGYAIRDSKLNRTIGTQYTEHVRLQLETYGWLYEQTFGEPPVALQVHTGSDQIQHLEYEGGADALATFEEILIARTAEQAPEEYVGVSKCSACSFHSHCWPRAVERQDVGLLPAVDQSLVAELHRQGAGTLPELLEQFDAESLAAFERPWGEGSKPVGDRAERILISARAIVEDRPILIAPPQLPAHDTYVMFDLEGVQPKLDELEKIYIWGMQPFGKSPGPFRAGTAGFGRHGDREGWEDFLRKADELFQEHGDIPFVHWASYEKTKIDLYLRRYGDRDGVAERVKRNLLDLLPITRASVAVPLSGYGLKGIETLTGYERQLEESGGEWSMAKYIEATETDDELERAAIMDEILAYNREDLEATWAVLEWLRGLAE